jgi:hypothetical protein
MSQALRDFVANPWIEAIASIPLLVTLLVVGALQVLDTPDGVIWIHRLWRASVWMGGVFLVLVATRFIVLSS